MFTWRRENHGIMFWSFVLLSYITSHGKVLRKQKIVGSNCGWYMWVIFQQVSRSMRHRQPSAVPANVPTKKRRRRWIGLWTWKNWYVNWTSCDTCFVNRVLSCDDSCFMTSLVNKAPRGATCYELRPVKITTEMVLCHLLSLSCLGRAELTHSTIPGNTTSGPWPDS